MTPTDREPASRGAGTTQRQHILRTALTLMSQQGVDGTSMRNLATAAGLNVASLYHYFPSKRDLLVAVLEERGFVDGLTTTARPSVSQDPVTTLAELLDDMLQSMLEVDEFIRLMLGEVLRGDQTAFGVGAELFAATQSSLEEWLAGHEPPLCDASDQPAMAKILRSVMIGVFIEYATGVLDNGQSPSEVLRVRAGEVARLLQRDPAG